MYHLVSFNLNPAFREFSVTPQKFNRQMWWLNHLGYKSINLDSLLEWRKGNRQFPEHPIILTFDDGFKDTYKYAPGTLIKYSQTAVFYLVVGKIGDKSNWIPEDGRDIPLMNWEEVHQLHSSGFQIGSHTMSHPRLNEIPGDVCRQEIAESKIILDEFLGKNVDHFCYPYGSYNEDVKEIVAETGYSSATSTKEGLSDWDDDPFTLKRIDINSNDNLLDFIFKLKFGRNVKHFIRSEFKLRKIFRDYKN
jgi:peptidoglycan/xylan/chitin deacetylase (PgdA/CDA1 family)